MTTKRCPSCGESKSAAEFGCNQSLGDGLSFYCLECNRAKSNAHYRKRRQALGKQVRDHSWVPEGLRWCPGCEQPLPQEHFGRSSHTTSGFSSWCKACKGVANSDGYFYRRYKLTRQELSDLRDGQDNRCAICDAPDPQHLDHDHATGGIRRLLCQRCNHGLGLFRDDPKLLHAAAYYVAFHTARQEIVAELDSARRGEDGASRPGTPPVGSLRRPGTRSTSSRSIGRTSTSRRQMQAGEADE